MPLSSDLIVALSRAYALTEIIPLRHPTIQDALSSVERLMRAAPRVTASVTEGGLVVEGEEIEDSQGLTREFARDLRAVEVAELEVSEGTDLGDVELFVLALRNTISGAQVRIDDDVDDSGKGGLRLSFRNGTSVRFVAAEPRGTESSGGMARSITRLFEAQEASRDRQEEPAPPRPPEEEADESEAPSEEAAEPRELVKLARDFLTASGEELDRLVGELERRAKERNEAGDVEQVLDAVRILLQGVVEGEADDEALSLARRLTTPAVANRLAAHLGGVWDEMERAEILEEVKLLANEMVEPVADALTEERDRRARRTYLDAMVAMGEAGLDLVEEMVEDPRWFVVRNAVAILGEIAGEEVVEDLTSTLGHEDPRVRRETTLALGKIGGEDAGELLLGMFDDPDEGVRAGAVRGVGVLRVQEALRPLLERLEKEDDDGVIEEIVRSLGQLGDPGAVPALEKRATPGFFSRPSTEIRVAAYRALAAIGTPKARRLVEEAQADRDAAVRTVAEGLAEEE